MEDTSLDDEISTTSTKKSGRKTITFVGSESLNFSDNPESINSTGGHPSSLRRFSAELSKERKAVKAELSKACKEFNLLIFMVYIQLCLNWYLIGVQFNAFCIRKMYMSPTVYSQAGVTVFSVIAGVLADIYGRRPVFIISSIILSLSSAILTASTNFIIFGIAKFMVSGSLVSINITLVTIYSELFRHKWRTVNTIMSFAFFITGFTLTKVGKFSNIIQVWRLKNLAFTLAVLIFVFGATMATVESPRFLMKRRQFKKVWDCLKELGIEEMKPDVQDYEVSKPTLKYQLKILTKLYFLHRMYTVLILHGVAIVFLYLFMSMNEEILLPADEKVQIKLLSVEVILIFATGIASMHFSKKGMVSVYYMLLGMCLFFNMLNKPSVLTNITSQAGYMFSIQICILNYTYLIEVFPTSHRATSLGLYFSITHIPLALVAMYQEELEISKNIQFFSGLYCGLCVICILISLVSPDSNIELPDRKQELFVKLTLSRTSIHSY